MMNAPHRRRLMDALLEAVSPQITKQIRELNESLAYATLRTKTFRLRAIKNYSGDVENLTEAVKELARVEERRSARIKKTAQDIAEKCRLFPSERDALLDHLRRTADQALDEPDLWDDDRMPPR